MTATFATFVPAIPGSTLASRPLGEATARGGGHPSPAASPRTVQPVLLAPGREAAKKSGACTAAGSLLGAAQGPADAQATGHLSLDRRHAVRRFDARPATCPHCDGRVTEGHYRDTGAATVMPIDVCPVLFGKRARGARA